MAAAATEGAGSCIKLSAPTPTQRRAIGAMAAFSLYEGLKCCGGALRVMKSNEYVQFLARRAPSAESSLTPREREVLVWAMEGKTNWEISVILSLSEATVKFHVRNAMSKLNATSRAQAVAVALRGGLFEPDLDELP